jgi:hypothetical protein
VQYFHEPNLVIKLAAMAGLRVEWQWRLKDDHDVGVLLRRQQGAVSSPTEPLASLPGDLKERLERRRAQSGAFLAELSGTVALYGTSWHGTPLLNVFQSDRKFALAFDDNAGYAGRVMYSREQIVPVCSPEPQALTEIDAVLITAYLHDQVIAGKLRTLGFAGQVFSARSLGTAGADAL